MVICILHSFFWIRADVLNYIAIYKSIYSVRCLMLLWLSSLVNYCCVPNIVYVESLASAIAILSKQNFALRYTLDWSTHTHIPTISTTRCRHRHFSLWELHHIDTKAPKLNIRMRSAHFLERCSWFDDIINAISCKNKVNPPTTPCDNQEIVFIITKIFPSISYRNSNNNNNNTSKYYIRRRQHQRQWQQKPSTPNTRCECSAGPKD